MSEDRSRGIRDFSKYDAMDTQALEEILRKDCEAPEGEGSDTEELLYVMEVLAQRREKSDTPGKTTQQAWESFLENYYPEQELAAAGKKAERKAAPWLRRLIAAAAVLALVICIPITARALSWEELWDIFARWAKETFSFVSGGEVQVSEPDRSSAEGFTSLRDALTKSNRDPDIAPTWLPDGYVLDEVVKDATPVQEVYYAIYKNGEKSISIRIHNHISDDYHKVEINEDPLEIYVVDNQEYYIFANYDQLRAVWTKGTYENIIAGDLTIEEMKRMIDSIGKG